MPTAQFEHSLNQQISAALNAVRPALHEPSLRDMRRAGHVEFLDRSDEAFARVLDEYGIEWRYKPRTFAVEWDDEGNFVDSFTPDFYVPTNDLYIEVVSTAPVRATEQARSVRLLRRSYPYVRIELHRPLDSQVERGFESMISVGYCQAIGRASCRSQVITTTDAGFV